jgi:3-hydroxyisobutyrate dehydrogenase
MSAQPPKLTVLGLGTMGRAIAGSALRSGIPVAVWDRNSGLADSLSTGGAEACSSVAEAVAPADVVITMVTDVDAVMSIATEQGLLTALRPGTVWVQMSTIGVEGTERLSTIVANQRPDVHFVDAPVSGSKVPAERGELVIFASGPTEVRARVVPVFDAIGQRTIWLGAAGAGSRMKLVNNVLLAFTAEGVANSFALAQRLHLDIGSVVTALEGSPLVSRWESGKIPRIANGEFGAEFALALALKDVRLALSEVGSDMFHVLAALADEWGELVDRGLGDEDVTVVTRALSG